MKPLRVLDRVHRRILVHRRPLGAALGGLAVWLVVQAAAPPAPETAPVWTAAHDLDSGTVLEEQHFRRTGFAPGSVPAAAVESLDTVLGRTLATPLGAGEPVTAAHLAGAERLTGYPGRVAVAVRIPDADVVALLTVGQRVALVATDPQDSADPERVVDDAAVVAVPRRSDDVSGTLTGRLVVFAVPSHEAEELAAAGTTRYLTVVWSQ